MAEISQKLNKNLVQQVISGEQESFILPDAVVSSWNNAVSLSSPDSMGLRLPQRGALFAIKSHWTVSADAATIVMPTGTGKTETMIATVVSEQIKRTLVVVPSDLLRKQIAYKFLTLGILQKIGAILPSAISPVVCTLNSTPTSDAELTEMTQKANIIISTATLLQRFSDSMISILSKECELLIVDEAHHIAAKTWITLRIVSRV